MKYADRDRCPDCRAELTTYPLCQVCGFDVSCAEITEIWNHLNQIDQLIASARTHQGVAPATAPAPIPPPVSPPPVPTAPPMPAMRGTGPMVPPPPPGVANAGAGGVSVGSVLLGLGAALLVVAALIFVSFTWSSLGLGARAAILLVVTLGIGAGGVWAIARRLRGSAEALWCIFAGFVSIDWFAAVDLGFFGDDPHELLVHGGWWIAMYATAFGAGWYMQRVQSHELMGAQIIAGLSLVPFISEVGHLLHEQGWTAFWMLTVPAVVAAATAGATYLLRYRIWAVTTGAIATVITVSAGCMALVEALANRHLDDYVGGGHAIPLLLVTIVCAMVGLVVKPARIVATVATCAGVWGLVAIPLIDPLDHQAWYLWGAASLIVLALIRVRADLAATDAGRGLGIATIGLAAIVTMPLVSAWAVFTVVLEGFAEGPDESVAITVPAPEFLGDARITWWVALIGASSLALALLAVSRWREVTESIHRRTLLIAAILVLTITGGAALLDAGAPLLVLTVLTVVCGIGVVVLARTIDDLVEWAGLALVAISPIILTPSWTGFTIAAGTSAVVLIILAALMRRPEVSVVSAAIGTAWLQVAALLVVARPSLDMRPIAAVSILLTLALASAVAGTSMRALGRWRPGFGIEVAGAAAAAVVLAAGTAIGDIAWMAAWCTAAGVVALAVGLLVADRNWLRFVAGALLGIAWILRLVAWEVDWVEAYTVPFAIISVAIGAWLMHRDQSMRTWVALGPGLLLGVVPTALIAFDEPVTVRALVIGLVAAALVGLGLLARWQAPFVLGSVVLVVLTVTELAPYTWALPRWVLLGAVGALLLAGGITWEKRVRDGRAVVAFVRSLR